MSRALLRSRARLSGAILALVLAFTFSEGTAMKPVDSSPIPTGHEQLVASSAGTVKFARGSEYTQMGASTQLSDLTSESRVTTKRSLRKPFSGSYRVNSWFDHDEPTLEKDDYIVLYTGERLPDPEYGPLCTYGVNCYDGHNGIDFRTGYGTPILAAADGEATVHTGACPWVSISHSGGYETRYVHLSQIDIEDGDVSEGDRIGLSGSTCADSAHLHFEVRLNGTPVDPYGWRGDYPDPWDEAESICLWKDADCPPTCPSSGIPGRVVFYKAPAYGCLEKGEGEGYYAVRVPTALECAVSAPQWVQLPPSLHPLSVRVPSGYYITLHLGFGTGFTAIRYASDPDFRGDYLFNYFGVNAVMIDCLAPGCLSTQENMSLTVGTCPANSPPNTPRLVSPSSGYLSRNYRAPTLCWKNQGDPQGDQLYFYAEVYDSPVNANSGWITNTCWRPSQLDYRYHSYQWRVKAKDPPGAQSDWSQTWNFTIAAPNRPPSISFDQANGSGFSSAGLDSRTRNWIFQGTASDPEGRLSRIEFRCSGDNCGTAVNHANGTSWSHTQNSMAGRNDVYFVAYDAEGYNRFSRHLDLRIDLGSPKTQISLNGDTEAARWPTWFRQPVEVKLSAVDRNTGRARSGVKEIRYRLDGGAWQVRGGNTIRTIVSNDGSHSIQYYAVDKVGNPEASRTTVFQIDQTPPSPPSGAVETGGALHNEWQNSQATPIFAWAASNDATSGLWGYQLYFGQDPNGQAYRVFLAADPREWTPQPYGVHTGVYYLRGRSRDNAGNWSPWTDMFTFRYDGTPPENPANITHTAGITSTVWQRTTSVAEFGWEVPHDEGSGIGGYYVYWGTNPAGVTTELISENSYSEPTPLCPVDAVCTGYLRLRSVDNVGNLANEWSTGFVLRYDNVAPEVDFTFNGGVTETNQVQISLDIMATDEGSGVRAMRFSGDGQQWTPWEAHATSRSWLLPAISRQFWPLYAQVQDGVRLDSEIVSHTIYLDANTKQTRSANYRLFDHTLSAGSGHYTSTLHTGHGTVGQVMDSTLVTSTNFVLAGGYEAGSQALPVIEPGHEDYTYINGIFSSGTCAETLASTRYTMVGTFGEAALPVGTTTITSTQFVHQPGFLAAASSVRGTPPSPAPGPPPPPEDEIECETPRIRIEDDEEFTNSLDVSLSICAPQAAEMMLSNYETFAGSTWEPYAQAKPWRLSGSGEFVSPRFVYATFRNKDGVTQDVYFDDIIYDPNLPTGLVMVGDSIPVSLASVFGDRGEDWGALGAVLVHGVTYVQGLSDMTSAWPLAVLSGDTEGGVALYIDGFDDNSGIVEMQISASPAFTDTLWEPFTAETIWTPPGPDDIKTVYARLRDGAGNISDLSQATFLYDTQPPIGGLWPTPQVIGPDAITITLWLAGWDNLSGVADVRLDSDPGFSHSVWQPYTDTMTIPLSPTMPISGGLFVQYRDLAGNVSDTFTNTYWVDASPPYAYVAVSSGDTLTRTVSVYAYDSLSAITNLYLSNDPSMLEGVLTVPYTSTLTWGFDESRVAWIQVEDALGNRSEPYPVYADSTGTPEPGKVYLPLVLRSVVAAVQEPQSPDEPLVADHNRVYLPLVLRQRGLSE